MSVLSTLPIDVRMHAVELQDLESKAAAPPDVEPDTIAHLGDLSLDTTVVSVELETGSTYDVPMPTEADFIARSHEALAATRSILRTELANDDLPRTERRECYMESGEQRVRLYQQLDQLRDLLEPTSANERTIHRLTSASDSLCSLFEKEHRGALYTIAKQLAPNIGPETLNYLISRGTAGLIISMRGWRLDNGYKRALSNYGFKRARGEMIDAQREGIQPGGSVKIGRATRRQAETLRDMRTQNMSTEAIMAEMGISVETLENTLKALPYIEGTVSIDARLAPTKAQHEEVAHMDIVAPEQQEDEDENAFIDRLESVLANTGLSKGERFLASCLYLGGRGLEGDDLSWYNRILGERGMQTVLQSDIASYKGISDPSVAHTKKTLNAKLALGLAADSLDKTFTLTPVQREAIQAMAGSNNRVRAESHSKYVAPIFSAMRQQVGKDAWVDALGSLHNLSEHIDKEALQAYFDPEHPQFGLIYYQQLVHQSAGKDKQRIDIFRQTLTQAFRQLSAIGS